MTEAEALAKMVPPGQIRPGKMGGGGVIQILLTRACTKACYGCTQGSNLAGKPTFMTLENFERAVRSLDGYPWLVALFGGQPTLHPQFPEICEILARHVPINRRGLWTNALNGHGAICRRVFLPQNCNLNVHLDRADYDEFRRDWPEAMPFGLDRDSRHSPPFVSMKDLGIPEEERWRLIADCPINKHWSSILIQFRGQLRAFFCEVAGAQAHLHENDPDYPDTGRELWFEPEPNLAGELKPSPIKLPWWRHGMASFRGQIRHHCHDCGVPMQGHGELAQAADGKEQVSEVHAGVYTPKRKGRRVELVTVREQLGEPLECMTRYLQNGAK